MKKNLAKKALVPAIAMVIVSVIALSGVTYAWFTTGTTATVSELNVNVQTANGIQISLDAASWKSSIAGSDIIYAIDNAPAYETRSIQVPGNAILPMSSAGNVANGKMEMFFGDYDKDGKLYSAKQTEKNGKEGNFVAFDLFVKSTMEQEMTISESSVIGAALDATAFTNVGTERAVRVAFLNLGCATLAKDARALTGDGLNKAIIWEPNANDRAPGAEGDENKKLPYDGFAKEFDDVDSSADNVQAVSSLTEGDIELNLGNGINKIRIYIWLEGQDVDCINNISFGDFAVNLKFAVKDTSASN